MCLLCRQASWLGILTPPSPAASHRSSRAPTAGAGLAEFLLVLEAPASWVSGGPSPQLCRQTPSGVSSHGLSLCVGSGRERERERPPVFPPPLRRTPVSQDHPFLGLESVPVVAPLGLTASTCEGSGTHFCLRHSLWLSGFFCTPGRTLFPAHGSPGALRQK